MITPRVPVQLSPPWRSIFLAVFTLRSDTLSSLAASAREVFCKFAEFFSGCPTVIFAAMKTVVPPIAASLFFPDFAAPAIVESRGKFAP